MSVWSDLRADAKRANDKGDDYLIHGRIDRAVERYEVAIGLELRALLATNPNDQARLREGRAQVLVYRTKRDKAQQMLSKSGACLQKHPDNEGPYAA